MIQLNMLCPLCRTKTDVLKVEANGLYTFQFYCAHCGGSWIGGMNRGDLEHYQSWTGALEVSIERAENVALKSEVERLRGMEERLRNEIKRLMGHPAQNRVAGLIDSLEMIWRGNNRHGVTGKQGPDGTNANGTIDY
jgi:hypothetical protein